MVQITIFWTQKWFKTRFLMVFHVSPWFVSFKTQKYLVHTPFREISSKRPIFIKNGSRSLKSRYLEITFLYKEWAGNDLETWNLAKFGYKMIKKIVATDFWDFDFLAIFGPILAFLAIFGQKLTPKWPKNQNFQNLLLTFFSSILYSN